MLSKPLEGKLGHLKRTADAMMPLKILQPGALYIEIGAHRGRSLEALSSHLLTKCENLKVIGYDVFEMADTEFHAREDNGKGAGNFQKCFNLMTGLQKENPWLEFELIKGYTTETLIESKADWAYIDGGHSYETVKWDHQKLKDSRVIIFDDSDLEGVNQYLWEIKDLYKIYDLLWNGTGARQSIIINDTKNYDFESANLFDFRGVDPTNWKPVR